MRPGDPGTRWLRVAIVAIPLALTAVGILFVHSAADCGEPFPGRTAKGQIAKAAVAVAAFAAATRLGSAALARISAILYALGLAALAGLLAAKTGGINRFVELAIVQVQPSELFKVALVLGLARYLRFRQDQRRLRGLVVPFAMAVVPMALVAAQPDLGTSLLFPAVLLGMLVVAGGRPLYLAAAVFLGAATIPGAYVLGEKARLLRPYQMERIQVFFRGGSEELGDRALQLRQSLIAIGSGGFAGKGYAKGTQNTLWWLPAKHTDFIYSVIGEEWGFAGAASVAAAFALLVLALLRVALVVREPFGRLAASGIAILFAAQSAANMAMTMGLAPVTGVPLPFVSHGGSSLLASYLGLAVAYGVAARPGWVAAPNDLVPKLEEKAPPIVQHTSSPLIDERWPVA